MRTQKYLLATLFIFLAWPVFAADIKMAVGECTLPTVTGNFKCTNPAGWQPKLVIVLATSASANDSQVANSRISYGITDGTNEWAVYSEADDALTTTQVRRRATSDETILLFNTSDAAVLEASGVGAGTGTCTSGGAVGPNSDGWCFNVGAESTSTAYLAKIIYLGGADMTVAVGVSQALSGTSAHTVTVGIDTDLLLVGVVGDAFADTSNGNSYLVLGAVQNTGTDVQHYVGLFDRAGEATVSRVNSEVETAKGAGQIHNDAVSWDATISNFTTTSGGQFDITPTIDPSGDKIGWASINVGAGNVWVGQIAMPTSTAANWTVTTPGFTPVGVGIISTYTVAGSLNAVTTGAEAGTVAYMAFDGTREFVAEITSEDDAATSVAKSFVNDIALNYHSPAAASVFDQDTDGSIALTSTGWDLTWGTTPSADGTARQAIAWAVGANITAGSIIPILLNQARRRR